MSVAVASVRQGEKYKIFTGGSLARVEVLSTPRVPTHPSIRVKAAFDIILTTNIFYYYLYFFCIHVQFVHAYYALYVAIGLYSVVV